MKKKTPVTRKTKTKPMASVAAPVAKPKSNNGWSGAIYVYWFIILFFIAATFYILGRSHNAPNQVVEEMAMNMVSDIQQKQQKMLENMMPEEQLLQANDYLVSGHEKLVAGDIDGAIAELTTSIESGNVAAYTARGEAYMQSGDLRMALDDFNNAIANDGTNALAYYDRALLAMRMEDYESALNDINNALALSANGNSPLQERDLYAKRGQLNLWLKNWEGAIADYTNSLARPDGIVSPNVYAERAEAYTAMGNYAEAINDYSSALRVISEQIQGTTTMEQNESLSADAVQYLEKSAALNVNLGNTVAAISNLQDAIKIANALNDTDTVTRLQTLVGQLN